MSEGRAAQAQREAEGSRAFALLPLLAIAVACLAIYWPTLADTWIRYDNELLIRQQPRVQTLALEGAARAEGLVEMFTTAHGDLYQPLLTFSVAIDYALFGWDRSGWHAHALALHVASLALLFGLAIRLGHAATAAGIAFTLAAIHPMLVETTTWLIHRTILVASLWIALGSHAYLSYLREPRRVGWLVLATLAYALSLLGKAVPSVLLIPLLLDLWVGRRLDRRALFEKLPLALLVVTIVGVNLLATRAAVDAEALVRPVSEMLREAPAAFALNVANLAWPAHLAIFYPAGTATDWLGARWIAAAIALAGVGALGLRLWQRGRRGLALSAGLWLALLLPSIAAGAYREVATADRYAYIGTLWLALGVSEALSPCVRRDRAHAFAALAIAAALAIPLGLQAHADAALWGDEIALWRRVVERTPHPTPYGAMGNVYLMDRKDRIAAASAYAEAVAALEHTPVAATRPNYLEGAARTAFWAAEEQQHRGEGEAAGALLEDALRYARAASRRWPGRYLGHLVEGEVLRAQGDLAGAARALGRAAIVAPRNGVTTGAFFDALTRLAERGERDTALALARGYAARFPGSKRAADAVEALETGGHD